MGWQDVLDSERVDEDDDVMRVPWKEFLIPFAAAGVSLLAGGIVGLAGGFVVGIAQAPTPEAAADVVSADDITFAKVCAPIQEEANTRIEHLNVEIGDLSDDIKMKQAKLANLEAEMDQRSNAGRKMWKELEQVREDLAIAMQEKEALQHEKAELIIALTRTEDKLERTEVALGDQVELTEHYRFESLDHNFDRFVHESKLAICERGNRKKLGNCQETVTSLLVASKVQDAFRHCVRSGQETPLVAELEKGQRLPEFSGFMDQGDRVVKDWYVHLCDPTLPEADTLVADAVTRLRRDG